MPILDASRIRHSLSARLRRVKCVHTGIYADALTRSDCIMAVAAALEDNDPNFDYMRFLRDCDTSLTREDYATFRKGNT